MTDLRGVMERAVTEMPPQPYTVAGVLSAAERDLRRRRGQWLAAGAAALAVVLGIAWTVTGTRQAEKPPVAHDDVSATSGSLALVALDHLARTPTGVYPAPLAAYPEGAVAATIRFSRPGEDVSQVVVIASPDAIEHILDCASMDACASLAPAGGTVQLGWYAAQDGAPGVVAVSVRRGREQLVAIYVGAEVTGDPRDLELPVTVEELRAIVTDERFDLTVSPSLVEEGRELVRDAPSPS